MIVGASSATDADILGVADHLYKSYRLRRVYCSVKPNRDEIDACRERMSAELELVKPKMILCLGATAAQSFAGAKFRVRRDRGKPMATPWAPWWMATYHSSALLPAPDPEARQRIEEEFLADLALARDHLRSLHAA